MQDRAAVPTGLALNPDFVNLTSAAKAGTNNSVMQA
jgi:hypothetical protein